MTQFLAIAKRLSARVLARPSKNAHDEHGGDTDGLLAFQAEGAGPAKPRSRSRRAPSRPVVIGAAVALAVASASIVYIASGRLQAARPAAPSIPATPTGMAMID